MYASTYNALSHLLAGSTYDTHAEKSYIYVKKLLNDIEAVDKSYVPKTTNQYGLLSTIFYAYLTVKKICYVMVPPEGVGKAMVVVKKIFRELNLYLQVSILIGN